MAEAVSSALAGKRVVITRAAAQSEVLARGLSALGAIPVVIPLVSFAEPEDFGPFDAALHGIEQFDWVVLTSAQAVRALAAREKHLQSGMVRRACKVLIACVGPVTAEAAREAGFRIEHVAEMHSGLGLAKELGGRLKGAKVFLPRSNRANPDLPAALNQLGAQVTEVIAYRTLRPSAVDEQNLKQVAKGNADAVVFFSPSAVQHFIEMLGAESLQRLQNELAITAVGPVTANALRAVGVRNMVLAGETTASAVVESLKGHFARSVGQAQAGAKRA